jgi:hypothetical protein
VHTPPKDFGLIDVTAFDPEDYLGRGKTNALSMRERR